MKRALIAGCLLMGVAAGAWADALCTPADILVCDVAWGIDGYRKRHDGDFPENLGQLEASLQAGLRTAHGAPVEELVNYYPDGLAAVDTRADGGVRIFACNAVRIFEDRRDTEGRYAIWMNASGRTYVGWVGESVLEEAVRAARGVLRTTGHLTQLPFEPQSSIYVPRIIRDAAQNHNVPAWDAAIQAEAHVTEVLELGAPQATNWPQMLMSRWWVRTHVPEQGSSVPFPTNLLSPSAFAALQAAPTTPDVSGVQSPVRQSPAWPLVAAATVLGSIVLAAGRRRFRPEGP